jgi:enoyl-CoA hydratase
MNYQAHGDVALLHFDDGKANAVGHDFVDAMNQGLDRAGREARAVVILGMDGKFSAGFDLFEFKKGPKASRALRDKGSRMLFRLFSHPQPVVAGCSGHAIAAGALILLACDSRIGRKGDFKIGLNETAIGMTLPVFALELARARISKRHLTAAVVQSQLYSPLQAVDVGFLDSVADAQDLQQQCIDLATQLAELPGESYAANKAGTRAVSLERIRDSLES